MSRPMLVALVALAALLAWAALAWVLNPGPRWRVADTQEASGNVLFDDDPVPAVDVEAMNDLLLGGMVIEWRGHGDLELLSPGHAVLALAPGTVVTLPAPPSRWFARTSRARLEEGTLRFLAGPRFPGATLVVETPGHTFEATGGAVAIVHEPGRGTRVETAGPAIEDFARTRRVLLWPPGPGSP